MVDGDSGRGRRWATISGMADVRLVDLDVFKRYSLAIRQEMAPMEELLAVLDATRAQVEAAGDSPARPSRRRREALDPPPTPGAPTDEDAAWEAELGDAGADDAEWEPEDAEDSEDADDEEWEDEDG
jgi:hypothetical protein